MRNERGFTLGEVLVAVLVLSVGLVGIATGFQYATSGVETGKGETTAAFLAEQRLERLKALALTNWTSATLSAGTTTEGYGSIADAALYRRLTTITDSPGGTCTANCKLVQVTVFYRPVTGRGQLDQERRLDVITMLVTRS
ncbi:MAG TPA: prepilin-type N-terminal cleavage/methylation domain-containing protein [Candidatus Binatia bacterium]|nr:prepilin-type N-terminal cleavage/methylation domain-containing protein [Candidatus Binatia bacterium]